MYQTILKRKNHYMLTKLNTYLPIFNSVYLCLLLYAHSTIISIGSKMV